MLIVGAKGFAKEVLEIFYQLGQTDNIAFYDDVNKDIDDLLFNRFPVLKNEEEVKKFFIKDKRFTIGIGNPMLRYKLYKRFIKLGGKLISSISPFAVVGNFDVKISKGVNILSGVQISNSVKIGSGCLVYYNSVITHDCKIGKFVEISPSSVILGRVKIGEFSHIGANATILPDIRIGNNVIVGAGAVVTKDIPDNEIWLGNPARFFKVNKPLNLSE